MDEASSSAQIVVARHGETAWSRDGRHTGRSEVPLTPGGEREARLLGAALAGRRFGLRLVSPLGRARETAALAGVDGETEPLLTEWDYGVYEGRSTPEIAAEHPGWRIWTAGTDGSPAPAEALAAVAARADAVLARAAPVLDDGEDVLLVAHAHVLRVLAARWLDLPPEAGSLFALDAACRGELGFQHSDRVLAAWNLAP